LRRASAIHLIWRLRFEKLRVRQDDPELIIQAVEEETEFGCFVHRSPRQQFFDAERPRHWIA
jgi:hypothetical protein